MNQNNEMDQDKLKEFFALSGDSSFEQFEHLLKETTEEEEKHFYLSLMNYKLQQNQRRILNQKGFTK